MKAPQQSDPFTRIRQPGPIADHADGSAHRQWMATGESFLIEAHDDAVPAREWNPEHWQNVIGEQIMSLEWRWPQGTLPFSQGAMINKIIADMRLPRVTAITYGGVLHVPDGPEMASYDIVGIEAKFANMRVRGYWIDTGTGAVPILFEENVGRSIMATDNEGHRRAFYVSPASLTNGGFVVSLVTEGEAGHALMDAGQGDPWVWGPTYEDAVREQMRANDNLGHSHQEALDIVAGATLSDL